MPNFTEQELNAIWEAAYAQAGDPSIPIEQAAILIEICEKIKPEETSD